MITGTGQAGPPLSFPPCRVRVVGVTFQAPESWRRPPFEWCIGYSRAIVVTPTRWAGWTPIVIEVSERHLP